MGKTLKLSALSLYVFGMLVLSVKCWNLAVVSSLLKGNVPLVLFLAYLIVGAVLFMKRGSRKLFNFRNNIPVIAVAVAVILSFIPAKLYYDQNALTSFVASRDVFMFLLLPVLLLIRPRMNDIRNALYAFSLIFLLIMLVDSFLGIQIVTQSESIVPRSGVKERFDTNFLDGIHFVVMGFLFAVDAAVKKPSLRTVAIAAMIFLTVLLYQNRTNLLACILIVGWYVLKLPNSKKMILVKCATCLVAVGVLFAARGLLSGLVTETMGDMSNTDYNRTLAYAYFLTQAPQGLTYLLGNSFLSSHSTPLMQDLMYSGIYNADVGFIGMWNQFGVIPIIVILVTCIGTFFGKKGMILKSNALFILLCSATTAYFVEASKIPWICLFWYMLAYSRTLNKYVVKG